MAQFSLEFPEIPPNPTNADLVRIAKLNFEAAKLTHDCLEQHRKAQEAGNIVLSSQIKSNADQTSQLLRVSEENCKNIKTMTGSVRAISRSVKAIDAKAEAAKKKAEEAANKAEAAATAGGVANTKLDSLNNNAWKFVWTIIAGITIAGVVAVCGLAYQATINHSSTISEVRSKK
jgi:TolA-binding protein